MLNVQTIPAFDDNYIWLLHQPNNPAVAVVDAGDADVVLSVLRKNNYQLHAILVTHHHFDHIGGIKKLLTAFPQAQVFAPAIENIEFTTDPVQAGDTVVLPALNCQFEVLDVSGHTRGHVAYYSADAGLVFCGDALFAGGCGRIFEGNAPQMFAGLQRLAQLPDETLIYCAHEYTQQNLQFAQRVEPLSQALQQRIKQTDLQRQQQLPTVPSRLSQEKATNPFLRCSETTVVSSTEQSVGHALPDACAVFASLRAWKDSVD